MKLTGDVVLLHVICMAIIISAIVIPVNPPKVKAAEKMTIVGIVKEHTVIFPTTGESYYKASSLADRAVTVVGFLHDNGVNENLMICGVENRLSPISKYTLKLERSDDEVCWDVKSIKESPLYVSTQGLIMSY